MTIEAEIGVLSEGKTTNLDEVIATLEKKIEASKKLSKNKRALILKEAVKVAIDKTPAKLLFLNRVCGREKVPAAFVWHLCENSVSGFFLLTPSGQLFKREDVSEIFGETQDEDWVKLGSKFLRPFEIAQMRSRYLKDSSE